MTPLMLSLIAWRAAHTTAYPVSSASVIGALVKLSNRELMLVDPETWEYVLTPRGKHLADRVLQRWDFL